MTSPTSKENFIRRKQLSKFQINLPQNNYMTLLGQFKTE